MKKNGMIILCHLISRLIIAQDDPASVLTADGYFENPIKYLSQVNVSNIGTGVLIDKVLFETNVFDFNGTDRVKTTDYSEWADLYTSFRYANVDTGLQSGIEVIKKISEYSYIESNSYPISILSFKFNSIKQKALDNGEFIVGADHLTDINSTVNSYSTHRLISSSSLTQNIYGDNVKFILPDYLFISNIPDEDVEQIQIDFGNGEGYRTVYFNEPIIVNYSNQSQYELCKIKTTLKNTSLNETTNYYSHFSFFRTGSSTVPLPDPINGAGNLKSASIEVIPEDFMIEYPSAYRKGEEVCFRLPSGPIECTNFMIYDPDRVKIHAYFLFSPQTHAQFPDISQAKLRRPLIICDGFDPGNKRDYYRNDYGDAELDKEKDGRGLFQLLNGDPSPWYSEEPSANLIERLRTDGYDIVIVNFLDGAGDITENAGEKGLRGFLNFLNSAYRDSKTEEAVLIGPSMGGLITRHALTSMEQAIPQEEHYVKMWFSFDSPQEGAYIPLGLQHAINYMHNVNIAGINAFRSKTKGAISTLNTTAAKQMLIHHYTQTSGTGNPSDFYDPFYDEIESLGYPKFSKNYGISNGGKEKLYDNDGNSIVELNILRTIGVFAWGNNNIDGRYNIHNVRFFPDRINFGFVYTESQIAFENAPGGWNASLYTINCSSGNKKDWRKDVNNNAHTPFLKATFMVTASTFGIEVTRDNVHNTWQDYANINGVPNGKIVTPFDEIHGMTENEEHVRISNATSNYLIDEALRPEFENTQRPVARNGHTIDQKVSGNVAYTVKENIVFGGNGNSFTVENGANVNVSAGNSITFKPGFSVKSGANFTAAIKDIEYSTVLKSVSTPLIL